MPVPKSHLTRREWLFVWAAWCGGFSPRGPARDEMVSAALLRLAYLGVANMFAPLRLLPASERDKALGGILHEYRHAA